MNPWVILGGFLLLIAVAFGAQKRGDSIADARVRAEWNLDKLASEKAGKEAILKAVAANQAAHDLDIKQKAKVIANYETTIDTKNAQISAARADADKRKLRINRAAVCNQLAATVEAAGSIRIDAEGEAATVELPAEIAKSLRDITEDADREIARKDAKIEALQQWAIDKGFATGR